jgi:hypothetical protein
MRFLVLPVLLLGACAPKPLAVVGWQDPDAHLVDGTWIGTETPCAASTDGLECRVVVDRALATLGADVRANVTKAAMAALPTRFVMATGETRMGHIGGGITVGRAVVVDVADGTRRVVGLVCYLPYAGDSGGLVLSMVDCTWNALDDWRDGNVPRYPLGTKFG